MTRATQQSSARQSPKFVEPMQCLPVAKLPEGRDWEYEIKFDGYRALGIKSGGQARLMSRNENDFSARFSMIAQALSNLPDDTIIDGEVVALDETGKPSFNVLQNYHHAATPLQFYAFDLLHLSGTNLRGRPLVERRALLRSEVMPRMPDMVRFSESFATTTAEMIAAAKQQGLEGVVAKRRDSRYEPGKRSGAWVKMRINQGQELMIGGYVPGFGNFDSIIAGYYEGDDLIYVARVRNGFVPARRAKLFERFHDLEIAICPFSNLPQRHKGRWGQELDEAAQRKEEIRELTELARAQIRELEEAVLDSEKKVPPAVLEALCERYGTADVREAIEELRLGPD